MISIVSRETLKRWLDCFAFIFEVAPFLYLFSEVREPRVVDAVVPDDVIEVFFGFFSG